MKTPNEQIKELIKKIYDETGEKVTYFHVSWLGVFGSQDQIMSIDVSIVKDN